MAREDFIKRMDPDRLVEQLSRQVLRSSLDRHTLELFDASEERLDRTRFTGLEFDHARSRPVRYIQGSRNVPYTYARKVLLNFVVGPI